MEITAEQSDLRDHHLPMQEYLAVRISKQMKVGITARALTEKRDSAAVVRRWIRLGASMEGVPIEAW